MLLGTIWGRTSRTAFGVGGLCAVVIRSASGARLEQDVLVTDGVFTYRGEQLELWAGLGAFPITFEGMRHAWPDLRQTSYVQCLDYLEGFWACLMPSRPLKDRVVTMRHQARQRFRKELASGDANRELYEYVIDRFCDERLLDARLGAA